MSDIDKAVRVKKELSRLKRIYKCRSKKERATLDGLIDRAAFMRIELEDMEVDLDTNGWTEMFTQSEKVEPYEKERPIAKQYQTLNANYQKIIKLLSAYVDAELPKEDDDGFDAFIKSRDT